MGWRTVVSLVILTGAYQGGVIVDVNLDNMIYAPEAAATCQGRSCDTIMRKEMKLGRIAWTSSRPVAGTRWWTRAGRCTRRTTVGAIFVGERH